MKKNKNVTFKVELTWLWNCEVSTRWEVNDTEEFTEFLADWVISTVTWCLDELKMPSDLRNWIIAKWIKQLADGIK